MLYLLINQVVCGVLADGLLAKGLLKAPMLKALPVTFGLTQLITALIGGAIGIILFIPLRKAIRLPRQ